MNQIYCVVLFMSIVFKCAAMCSDLCAFSSCFKRCWDEECFGVLLFR